MISLCFLVIFRVLFEERNDRKYDGVRQGNEETDRIELAPMAWAALNKNVTIMFKGSSGSLRQANLISPLNTTRGPLRGSRVYGPQSSSSKPLRFQKAVENHL